MTSRRSKKSENEELKNMLLTFRVSELQMLLGCAGQNKTGRKTELQARALEILKTKSLSPVLKAKIIELYKSIQQGGGVAMEMQPPPVQGSSGIMSSPMGLMNHPNNASLPGFMPLAAAQMQSRYNMYPYKHPSKIMTPQPPPSSPMYPIQPDVTYKRLPFYDMIGELLKPSSLTMNNTPREQTSSFFFFLTPQQASDIALNREVGPGTKNEYKIQVQMRFCLLETSCEQDDHFPPGLVVKVNNRQIQLPAPLPANQANRQADPKRPPRPLNISSYVKLCPSIANNISVTWIPEFSRSYVIVVNLVKKLAAFDLLNRLKSKGIRHADFTTGLIKEKLTEDLDSEIATTSLRVSLMCPLGKIRMSIPCRPSTCTHLQCFDATLYLQMNEKKPTWICPVCDKQALYDNLVIDGYFSDVLNSNLLPADSNEIQLHKDGSWSCAGKKETTIIDETSRQKSSKIEIIENLDSDDDDITIKEENRKDNKAEAKPQDISVVDLTVSDSEDDDRAKSKESNEKKNPIKKRTLSETSSITSDNRSPVSIITLDSPSPPPAVPTPPPILPACSVSNPVSSIPSLANDVTMAHGLPLPPLPRPLPYERGYYNTDESVMAVHDYNYMRYPY